MNGLHMVRFVTHGTETHVFLDDQEVLGCVKASFDYEVKALPVVRLELFATDVEVETECAVVEAVTAEPISVLNLPNRIENILRNGFWYNHMHERKSDPIRTVPELLKEYKAGRLGRYKGLGPHGITQIVNALRKKELI